MQQYAVIYSFTENGKVQTTVQDFATKEEAYAFGTWLYGGGNLTEIAIIDNVNGNMLPLYFDKKP